MPVQCSSTAVLSPSGLITITMQNTAIPVIQVDMQPQGRHEGTPVAHLRRLRILLLKPYQPIPAAIQSPPLGLLYLTASIRERFGHHVDIRVIDMKVEQILAEDIVPILREFQPDVVGLSALNFESRAGHDVARHVKQFNPAIITAFGGPYALKNTEDILKDVNIDWAFDGAADRTFPEALARIAANQPPGEDLPGFSWRRPDGSCHISTAQDQIKDLDSLPLPAWDLIDFDLYAGKPNFAANLKGRRYAQLFTSRGCPYLCSYCHDIFSKRFVHRSVEHVLAEIEMLYEQYGVDEFQIVDDIFNLHKPRLKDMMAKIQQRWPGKLKFNFPNGVRADIIDEAVVNALCDAGTYAVCIAVETVTPRLQDLVQKHLDIEKTRHAIRLFGKRDIQITGFFMLGFPTETPEEIKATLDFALNSELTLAYFFSVIPQKGTPLYDLAMKENPEVTRQIELIGGGTHRTSSSWYEMAYGYPLAKQIWRANLRFYFTPRRVLKVLRHWSLRGLWPTFKVFMQVMIPWLDSSKKVAKPE